MHQSRCGICCEECERKAEVNCSGCLQMTAPFWGGKCAIKTCCEEKGLDHCGVCPSFPCRLVGEMGASAGYDPAPRLANCRQWANQSTKAVKD